MIFRFNYDFKTSKLKLDLVHLDDWPRSKKLKKMDLKPVREAIWTMVYDRDVYFLDRSTYRKFTVRWLLWWQLFFNYIRNGCRLFSASNCYFSMGSNKIKLRQKPRKLWTDWIPSNLSLKWNEIRKRGKTFSHFFGSWKLR